MNKPNEIELLDLYELIEAQEKELAAANKAITLLLKELEWRIRAVEETVKPYKKCQCPTCKKNEVK